ncbi:MAG: phage terminase large subunit [Candidatus Omnitrophica bacterium]|nr:phage terminase large subunit [Candidatus Omnitrophota bacterium]
MDADLAIRLPDHLINTLITYGGYRNYQRFYFETNQFQEFVKDILEQRSREKGVSIPIEGINHTGDKGARIEALQPMVKSGAIQFSKKHHMLLEQMKFFPKGAHDDGLDALEMAVKAAKDGDGVLIWSPGDPDLPWKER